MAKYLGLSAVGWPAMLLNWWNLVLAYVFFFSFIIGVLVIVFYSLLSWKKRRQNKIPVTTPVKEAALYLERSKHDFPRKASHQEAEKTPRTFGVYLGSFESPPTKNQQQLLSSWDLTILNPAEYGVLEAASSNCQSSIILGRLDLQSILAPIIHDFGREPEKVIATVLQTLTSRLTSPRSPDSPFTGVLLANWQSILPLIVCNALIQFISNIGLHVYVEISPPDYLTVEECRELDLQNCRGLVCRNGTIFEGGDRRDYFQMAELRRALRALAAKSQMTNGYVLMWDMVDSVAQMNHGVIKRSYNWCRFYSALSWVGPKAALTDADVAVQQTLPGEPLGALAYIKDDNVVKLHEKWRLNNKIAQEPCDHAHVYQSIDDFVPNLASRLSLSAQPPRYNDATSVTTLEGMSWPIQDPEVESDPFAFSPRGHEYTGLGCFQIGLDAFEEDFAEIIAAQRQLKELNLLKRVDSTIIGGVVDSLTNLVACQESVTDVSDTMDAIKELISLLQNGSEGTDSPIRVFMGLHSGFRTGLENRFWGLYDLEGYMGGMDVFVSLKAVDLASTILHTYLSSRHCSRTQCLQAEVALAEANGTVSAVWDLPTRFVRDIEGLTPTEAILFLRHIDVISQQSSTSLAAKLRACCEYQLLEVPTLQQLRAVNSVAYLRGEATAKDLVDSRFAWYRQQGCPVPSESAALKVFHDINARLPSILFSQNEDMLNKIQRVLEHILANGHIDAGTDIFCLSLFCAFRKLGINEVYLEVLDRNPHPNPHPDQAACFAEMFALGSRCEAFFDMTPNEFGRILEIWYFAYFKMHPPPMRDDKTTEIPTAYASKQVDLNLDAGQEKLPLYYQITFLGIFAFPALIDIMLLTTIGRGLYLSSYMSEDEKLMATTALMLALFLTGAVGTWIGSGGSYYLFSMAYPAMNMFVLTRWVAGIALCIMWGVVGFIVIAAVKNPYAAFIFFYYLVMLTAYLTTLASLAIYQLPGFQFQSGRSTVAACIPILFISPILTLFVGHDIAVYLCVLTTFLLVLLVGACKVMSDWSTWFLDIKFVSDQDIVKWYVQTKMSNPSDLPLGVEDISVTPLPRIALWADVERELKRSMWSKPTKDEFVRKVVSGYSATSFLMSWYCQYSRTVMPFPYSTTWNLQCKAAIDTLKSMQKGLKFHNAFVHWRHSGDEVYCGVLYFVIALMDKWVALLSGGSLVGLSAADSADFRLPVGFALAYYLISAIFLDAVAQPLWPRANKLSPIPIHSFEGLRDVAQQNQNERRKLYWSNLGKFFFMHIWALAVTAALMWIFEDNLSATIMYAAYLGAYTGLLLYQYNRIFTGTLALTDLLIASGLGLVVGITINDCAPTFEYGSTIALAISTWTAAFLSLTTAKVGWPKIPAMKKTLNLDKSTYYSASALGLHVLHSRAIAAEMYQAILAVSPESRYTLDPLTYPGLEILSYLRARGNSPLPNVVRAAFLSGDLLIHEIADMWQRNEILVDLVPARELGPHEQKMKYVGQLTETRLHICVLLDFDLADSERGLDIHRNTRIIAENIIQAATEAKFGLQHGHAALSQVLALDDSINGELTLPESMKKQLDLSPEECTWFIDDLDQRMLRHAMLDLDCDRDWDLLPKHARIFLLDRCRGKSSQVSEEQVAWMCSRFKTETSVQVREYVNRCNLEASIGLLVELYIDAADESDYGSDGSLSPEPQNDKRLNRMSRMSRASQMSRRPSLGIRPLSRANTTIYETKVMKPPQRKHAHVRRMIPDPIVRFHQGLRGAMKFFVVVVVADPEFQRELEYVMSNKPRLLRWVASAFFNTIWMFCKKLQQPVIYTVQVRGREQLLKIYRNMKGKRTTMTKNRVTVESAEGDSTCFITNKPDGGCEMRQYTGLHKREPEGAQKLTVVNTYANNLILRRREEYAKGKMVREFLYDYVTNDAKRPAKVPISRKCIHGTPAQELVEYDERGYVKCGSYIKDKNLTEFTFWYRDHAKFDDELLRAEFVTAHMTIDVLWCIPSEKYPNNPEKAIPYTHVIAARFAEGQNVYHSKWTYEHKSHPVVVTTLNGKEVPTPPMIADDWYKVLKRPTQSSFLNDDPLFMFKSTRSSFLSRLFKTNIRYCPISTSRSRNHLWKSWKSSKDVDAVTARWLDEWSLRNDTILKPYWNARDVGQLSMAENYLDKNTDTLMARVDFDSDVSAWTNFAFKTSDLYTFGQGGDTVINTRRVATQVGDTDSKLHVLAMDTGTWPMEGGGVSACRRDMVNDLTTIRWHVVAECANDYGFPKFQIERNVQSLSVLPLWGLDYLTPCHGIFENYLDSQVQEKSYNTSDNDIKTNFIPILTTLVRCARAIKLDHHHIEEGTKALLDLNKYFESSRHWSDIWMSDVVKDAWKELWLAEGMENTKPMSEWMTSEHPTLAHLDNALDMWQRYLFIFSLPVPEKIPDVFQASHHFAGASYGIICKIKRGCAFHVWDHCISWREVTVFLSSAMSFDPPFVCTSLIFLSRILSVLTLHHADVVLPCADFFNPGWEVELGSIEGKICHRKTYARKIDPVVNGICNMEKFEPIKEITSKKPTAVMLSHVRFVKDIKNAILAADIIVNEWGLKDYRLDIYGDMEKAPAYATECQEVIAAKDLRDYVVLRGLGSPSSVLKQAWLFLNSSVSEGLPLAMGEAALTGVPVVCTDVGASFRVVTDQATGKAFSAVCPPNDAYALAKAQVSIMGLLGEWAAFADDPEGVSAPELPLKLSPEQSAAIAKRMYEKADHRRRLGMMGRANVLSSFSSERYLREHEQMLWLAKHQSKSFHNSQTPFWGDSTTQVYSEKSKNLDSNYFWYTRQDL